MTFATLTRPADDLVALSDDGGIVPQQPGTSTASFALSRVITPAQQRELLTGALFLVAGGGFAAVAATYPAGTATNMGPGWFPLVLGLILAGLGLSVALPTLWQVRRNRLAVRQQAANFSDDDNIIWRPILSVLVALTSFALLLPITGLLISTFVLVLAGSTASQSLRWREASALAAGLSALVAVLFIGVLGIPLALLPASLSLL